MRIAVTGANGFVGRFLCRQWADQYQLVSITRVQVDFSQPFDVTSLLTGVDALVHTASVVHVLSADDAHQHALCEKVNHQATLTLARQANTAGVRHMIFLSTTGVIGNHHQKPLTVDTPANPQNAYAISKWQAEQGMHRLGQTLPMGITILRPPLMIGAGARGNLLRLMQAVACGVPLPFASLNNARHMLSLPNLASAIEAAMLNDRAYGKTYLLSDDTPMSTAHLVRAIASVMQKPARLWPCPPALLRLMLTALGKRSMADSLFGSLIIDSSTISQELGWQPQDYFHEALAEMVQCFMEEYHH